MSISYSPSIVTDNLIFAYDMNNIKSYKGPAFQNLTNTINLIGIGTTTGYSSTGITETIDIPTLGPTTVYTNIIQNNYTSYTPNNTNCCPSLHAWGSFAISPSTLYTYLILYRCDSGYTYTNYMYRYEYTANGGTYVTEGGVHNTSNRVHLGDGWYYAWGTFTTQATTNWIGHAGTFYYRYSQSTDKLSVAKAMIVKGDYSGLHPKYWINPTVNRTNTQVLYDLLNLQTLTANSLTYSSNGIFSFNGTTDIINTSLVLNSPNTMPTTIEMWFKNTSDTTYKGLIGYSIYQSSGISIGLHGKNTLTISYNANGLSYEPQISYDSSTTTHLILIFTGRTFTCYRNSVLMSSLGTASFDGVINTSPIYIGSNGQGGWTKFQGDIYSVKIYNRVLTPKEVSQNFNATRGRFNI